MNKTFKLFTVPIIMIVLLSASIAMFHIGCTEETEGFTALYEGYFQKCAECHSPDGMGRTDDIEKNLDFTTQDTAYSTITSKSASGMVGNTADCNGVSFITSGKANASLILAVLDENVREGFASGACDKNTISDMANKSGSDPNQAFLDDLKAWINDGAAE